ncbi:MAG: hypothetical protein HY040_05815 [Planctomycetes bacterium]|nr:hypothetical protein [Planctomycetota bacterium]
MNIARILRHRRRPRDFVRKWALIALVGVVLGVAGCGNSVPEADLERARNALETSLEAWESANPEKPAQAPSVQFIDPDQASGIRLVSYSIERCAGRHGENIRCWTKLALENSKGGRMDREVVFEIKLGEQTTIGRDPFN